MHEILGQHGDSHAPSAFGRPLFHLTSRSFRWMVAVLALWLMAPPPGAQAQSMSRRMNPREGVVPGGELERYLRVLQVAGESAWYPWTIRGFTAGEVVELLPRGDGHPWAERVDFSPPHPDSVEWGWTRPSSRAYFNSGFPFGDNDGAVWAGKGLSVTASAGGFLRWGRLHVRVAPEVWWSQNAGFALADNGLDGDGVYRDGRHPNGIDLPQQFGPSSIVGAALGTTQFSLRLPGVTLGVSGGPETWGPSDRYPLLMGTNAGGLPHLFVQTSGPLDIGIGGLGGRLVFGSLGQSDWSPVQTGETRRFLSGAVLTFMPEFLSGLELGAHRVVSGAWPQSGVSPADLFRPFTGGVRVGSGSGPGQNPREENQIAGVFFRWTFPSAGIEVWAESVREDFARDIRHYLVEPDDLTGRSLGFRRVSSLAGGRLFALRAEVVSADLHHSEREDRFRVLPIVPIPPYHHYGVPQGHTQKGQLLASPAAYGGSAVTLGGDLYTPDGRWTLEAFRELRQDWLASMPSGGTDIADVLYGFRIENVRFGDGFEITSALVPTLNLNRNVERGNDVFNLNLTLGITGRPW